MEAHGHLNQALVVLSRVVITFQVRPQFFPNVVSLKELAVVKEVKNLLGVGLKDAKGLVDDAPGVIKEGDSKEEAESIKAALEAAGAEVELK